VRETRNNEWFVNGPIGVEQNVQKISLG